ncbi:hypothetical protein AAHA92_06317 [Salvia divinorum]|uniref:Uncharacterized protein n=1 Tax=Salvia divinorum TaxID=28513 RepID=A0ABD1I7W0_SALDI
MSTELPSVKQLFQGSRNILDPRRLRCYGLHEVPVASPRTRGFKEGFDVGLLDCSKGGNLHRPVAEVDDDVGSISCKIPNYLFPSPQLKFAQLFDCINRSF